MLTFQTKRLTLRPLGTQDFEAVHAYGSDLLNTWYMPFGPNSEESTRSYLADCAAKWAETPLRTMEFAVVLEGKVIGACALRLRDEDRQAEMGWILHRDFWGRGYIAEAARALMDYGFTALHLHRIFAVADGENLASLRVMEKLGMRREGYKIRSLWGKHGTEWDWRDLAEYGMLDSEYDAMLHPAKVTDSADAAMKARRFS